MQKSYTRPEHASQTRVAQSCVDSCLSEVATP